MTQKTNGDVAVTGAEALLRALKFHGITYLFANAGTDFPPIIEAMAKLSTDEIPTPVTIPHETAAVAMAHGYWLTTGAVQALMVHVNVGLANTVMGVINAASDNVPVLVMSGRTPITEQGRKGARMTPIQYGQEMFDQASLVSDVVKYHYEMRYPEQAEPLVARALAAARSAPEGPVYLSLPREPLAEAFPPARIPAPSARPAASAAQPDPDAIARVAGWLAEARAPVLLVQRGDPAGALSTALQAFALRLGVAVAEPFVVRNVMPSAHPCFLGYDPGAALKGADLVIALDCDIPWIEALHRPDDTIRIVHAGADPHFLRMPVRGYRTDLAVQADPAAFVRALDAATPLQVGVAARLERLATANETRRTAAAQKAEAGCAAPISAEWLSRCLSDVLGADGIVLSELGVLPGAMDLAGGNRLFANPHSGGLGWALPAALGAQLADRDRLTVACIGDGSYIFANPVACHQIAEALALPVLVVIKNNGLWNAVRRSVVNAYPDGAAAKANAMPLTSLDPAPDYLQVAAASRAHVERVDHGRDLPAALQRALEVIRTERRQAVLDVRVEVSDAY
jgi:acetolactate synthase-1/2/3 large subunit